MKQIKIILLGFVALCAASCVTQKQLTYLHDADASTTEQANADFKSQAETIIRKGDAVTIFVSALDQEAVTPYNLPTAVFSTPGTNSVQTTPMLQYYIVNDEGDVTMPVLGAIHIEGLSRAQAEALVRSRVEQQVVNPTVQIRLINGKVSVLGEVNRPGYVSFSGDRLTILEALAAAGDLTVYGKRDNVLVSREVNGIIEMQRVNLRSTDLYKSPVYYLQQNDVIYVSPNKVRAISSTNAGLWLSVVSTALSAVTVIVTVVK